MNITFSRPTKRAITSMLLLFTLSHYSQNLPTAESLNSAFEAYTKNPREVAYVHLNKSTYIKGETIGFSAYVLDKKNKQLSTITTNLYCVINDKNDKVIKKKLINVSNGVARGEFFTDSLFSSGDYTFKAYTNWMRNFDEQNYYIQNLKIIDPETQKSIARKESTSEMDVQFLPEGGHLIVDAENTVGVVIKDESGLGISSLEGDLLDASSTVINSFKTNQFGIGKFAFTPQLNDQYQIVLKRDGATHNFELSKAEAKGINLSLKDLGSRVAITFNTNANTMPSIQGKTYRLTIHNGHDLKAIDLSFADKMSVTKLVNYTDLSPGINTFTLFDGNNKPLLERIFFKYDGISFLNASEPLAVKQEDSVLIQFTLKNMKPSAFKNLSVSVLPEETRSYQHDHNIASYTLLQPYVNGAIENARYYFSSINRKKKYELDMLLLTQGWSSYDWNTIFNTPPNTVFDFETGIRINATVNRIKSGQFLLYPTKNSKSNIIVVSENEKSFERTDFVPLEGENIKIGEILKNGKVDKPGLFMQFTPSKIPDLNKKAPILRDVFKVSTDLVEVQPFYQSSLDRVQELDEVIVTARMEDNRLEKLNKSARGRVDLFDDNDRQRYADFGSYISSKGFRVNQSFGNFTITNTSSPTPNNRTPLIYLDGVRLSDFSILYSFRMDDVDYVEIDKSGFGEGIQGSAGVIKIVTNPSIGLIRKYGKSYQEYDIPLTFAVTKRFYAPVYSSYQSRFYNNYGVIDWFPNCTVNDSGIASITIYSKASNVKLFIEGMTSSGEFISEEKIVNLNQN